MNNLKRNNYQKYAHVRRQNKITSFLVLYLQLLRDKLRVKPFLHKLKYAGICRYTLRSPNEHHRGFLFIIDTLNSFKHEGISSPILRSYYLRLSKPQVSLFTLGIERSGRFLRLYFSKYLVSSS